MAELESRSGPPCAHFLNVTWLLPQGGHGRAPALKKGPASCSQFPTRWEIVD